MAKSSLLVLPLNKQRFVSILCIFPTIFLSNSFIQNRDNSLAYALIQSKIATLRTPYSVLVHHAVFRNSNQDIGEEDGHFSSGNIDPHDEDIIEISAVFSGTDIPLPIQSPNYILTSVVEKQRRERERSLLAQVQDGDEAIKELRILWGSQSGNDLNEELLYEASRGIGDPRLWETSREMLEKLTRENPTFLEPFARLSKLYCLMGRFEDSQTIALEVLKLKPWHILAIETMVATSYALNQIESSLHWASQRMPPPSQTEKRKEWVRRAIEHSLEFESKLFTKPKVEDHEIQHDKNVKDEHSFCDEEDSWQ